MSCPSVSPCLALHRVAPYCALCVCVCVCRKQVASPPHIPATAAPALLLAPTVFAHCASAPPRERDGGLWPLGGHGPPNTSSSLLVPLQSPEPLVGSSSPLTKLQLQEALLYLIQVRGTLLPGPSTSRALRVGTASRRPGQRFPGPPRSSSPSPHGLHSWVEAEALRASALGGAFSWGDLATSLSPVRRGGGVPMVRRRRGGPWEAQLTAASQQAVSRKQVRKQVML